MGCGGGVRVKQLGLVQGKFTEPDAFFKALSDEEIDKINT